VCTSRAGAAAADGDRRKSHQLIETARDRTTPAHAPTIWSACGARRNGLQVNLARRFSVRQIGDTASGRQCRSDVRIDAMNRVMIASSLLLALSSALSSPAIGETVHATSPFGVLLDDKRVWTYDIVADPAGKPTGQVTLSVRAIDTQGAYTLIDLDAKGNDQVTGFTLLIGPKGVREIMSIGRDDRDEAAFRLVYDKKYLPHIYLPAPLKKQQIKADLDRFGEDNRTYKVTGALAKLNPHTWRMTWKGSYTVAEGEAAGAGTKTKYEATVDFDPGVGFTLICPADGETPLCIRLRP
jgi:hypothetical protein